MTNGLISLELQLEYHLVHLDHYRYYTYDIKNYIFMYDLGASYSVSLISMHILSQILNILTTIAL